MNLRIVDWLFVCVLIAPVARAVAPVTRAVAPGARAQEEPAFVDVELRVTATRPGIAVVDRGSGDGLAVGDRILFHPRGDRVYDGRIIELDERTATVEIDDANFLPSPGMRAEARVRAKDATPAEEPQEPAAPLEHPPWENQDPEWKPGAPLLAKVDVLHPAQRVAQVSGRVYLAGDQTFTNEDDRSDAFYRTGFDVLYENPFGRGDGIHFDAELNDRRTDVPDDDDDDGTRLRIDRLSYFWGGHRFAPERWELGRFLQSGFPEFGELDGIEWSRRTPRGHSFGASVGAMPEPDADHESGDDVQLAAWYRWVADQNERLSAAAGFQKTFHDGDADRDLLVTRLDYVPPTGWTMRGTTWIDFYGSGDEKGAGPDLTQAYITAGPQWKREQGLRMTYQHFAFPEIEREEFTPIAENALADDHNDRLAVKTWISPAHDARILAEVGGWVDEHDSGGDAEVGFEVDGLLLSESRTALSAFWTQGRFSNVLGARCVYGRQLGVGRFDVGYEITQQDQSGFDTDNDDFLQHRIWANVGIHTTSAWSFSAYTQGIVWDDELAVSLGIYLQRSF